MSDLVIVENTTTVPTPATTILISKIAIYGVEDPSVPPCSYLPLGTCLDNVIAQPQQPVVNDDNLVV